MVQRMKEGESGLSPGTAAAPHFLHVFPSFGLGGVPIRIANVINHFGARFRHSILATNGCFDARSRIDEALSVSYLEASGSKFGLTGSLLSIRRQLRQIRPDLLITYNWGSIEWALANNLSPFSPHLHMESGFGPEEATRQIQRRVLTRRLALARAGGIVVPSNTLVRIATEVWRIDTGKLHYIPNGIDCERFARAAAPDAIPGFQKADDEVIVGTVTPLRAEKNLARLIRAFGLALGKSKARLLIAGDGVERDGLVRLADDLGLSEKVVFAGHIESVENVLGLFDIYALSSDTEQMPNSLLQAMAAGLPVAGVDVGDVKPIVAEANRVCVTPRGDDQLFSQSIARLIGDAGLRESFGAANRARVREVYHQDRMFRAYEDIYEGLL